MPELHQFISAAAYPSADRSLVLSGDQLNVTARTAWRSRLVERFQKRDNCEVTLRFLQALYYEYGKETFRATVLSSGLLQTLTRRTPLRVRHVRAAIENADLREAEIMAANNRCAESYWKNLLRGPRNANDHFQPLILDIVRRNYGGDESIAHLVNYHGLAESVADAIRAAGMVGESAVRTIDEAGADEICRSIVDSHLFGAARKRALQDFDPSRPGSIGHQELETAYSQLDSCLVLKRYALSPDAVEALNRKFASAIDSAAIKAESLGDQGSLRELARNTVGTFMDERGAARARVSQIQSINEAERHALLDQVTCDTIPEHLVEPLGRAHLLLGNILAHLAPGSPPATVQQSAREICLAIRDTLQQAQARLDSYDEDQAYRHAWRFLLAPGGKTQATEILGQIALPRSPLRNTLEAARWYATEFKGTSAAGLTLREHRGTPKTRIHDDKSFELANSYDKTLMWLTAVAAEKIGPGADRGARFVANANPTDKTVATLRDLGIPFPAPSRMGRANPNASLSRPSLAKIQKAIDRKVADTPELHQSGVTNDCVKFLRQNELTQQPEPYRAFIFFDGVDLPRPTRARAAVKHLRNFCRDTDGSLNRKLLASVSKMVNHHTFDCLYSGCMNPFRPDLSIMNGYPRGVMEGHSYSLWKEENGEVRLDVSERVTPLKLYPMSPDAGLATPDGKPDEAGLEWQRLSGGQSDFRIQAILRFNPEDYRPEIYAVNVAYCLVPGEADPLADDPGYWVGAQDASEAAQGSAGRDRATPIEGDLARQGPHPDSLEVETRPDLEPLYSTIRLHRSRTPQQSPQLENDR